MIQLRAQAVFRPAYFLVAAQTFTPLFSRNSRISRSIKRFLILFVSAPPRSTMIDVRTIMRMRHITSARSPALFVIDAPWSASMIYQGAPQVLPSQPYSSQSPPSSDSADR